MLSAQVFILLLSMCWLLVIQRCLGLMLRGIDLKCLFLVVLLIMELTAIKCIYALRISFSPY